MSKQRKHLKAKNVGGRQRQVDVQRRDTAFRRKAAKKDADVAESIAGNPLLFLIYTFAFIAGCWIVKAFIM